MYACKDSEPTGATADLFKDMVNAVDATDADQVTGKSMCAKMLIKTVGRRDVSGPKASFELSGLALWRCSRSFTYLSMSGSTRLERDGDTATRSTPLDKYLARPREEHCSWYHFACKDGKVPVVSGGATHATWPLNEDYCRTMLLLHWPNWFDFLENREDYHPLRLVVSGTAGTGKSYVIKCLQRLVRQVVGVNDAIQVITPTGKAAYLVQGRTAHSFLGIPTDGSSCNELTVPSGPFARENSEKV